MNFPAQKFNSVKKEILHHDEPMDESVWGDLCTRSQAGVRPKCKMTNVEKMLKAYGVTVRINEVRKDLEISVPNKQMFSYSESKNSGIAFIRDIATTNNMPLGELDNIVKMIADKNRYNPVLDWIKSKPWDGVCRKQQYFDTIETPPEQEAIKKIYMEKWAYSAAVIGENESEMSYEGVLVFHGLQAAGKSSWLRWLAGDMKIYQRGGIILDLNSKDSIFKAIRCWIGELGELDATFKKSEIGALKAFITDREDVVRPSYGKFEAEMPRKTVYAASINEESFLVDKTGNRRWWVLTVEKTHQPKDFDHQQFWAQMYHEAKQKITDDGDYPWFIRTETEVRLRDSNNLNFEKEDPILDEIITKFDPLAEPKYLMTAAQVSRFCDIKSYQASKVGASLKRHFKSGQRHPKLGARYMMPEPISGNAEYMIKTCGAKKI